MGSAQDLFAMQAVVRYRTCLQQLRRKPRESSSRSTNRTGNSWGRLAKGLSVIRAFGKDSPAMSVSQVARSTGHDARRSAAASSHSAFAGLCRMRRPSYRLAPKTLELGFSFLSSHGWLSIASPLLENLKTTLSESVSVDGVGGYRRRLSRPLPGRSRHDAFDGRRIAAAGLLHRHGPGAARRTAGTRRRAAILDGPSSRAYAAHGHRQGGADGGVPQGAPTGYAIIDQELRTGSLLSRSRCATQRGAVLAAANVCGHASHLSVDDLETRCLPALRDCVARISRSLVGRARSSETELSDAVRSTIQKRDAKGAIRHGGEWLALWSDPDSMKTGAELRQEAAERGAVVDDRAPARRRGAFAVGRSRRCRSLSGSPARWASAFDSRQERPRQTPRRLSALRGEIDSLSRWRGAFTNPTLHADLAPDGADEAECYSIFASRFVARRSARCVFAASIDNLVACHRERLRKSDLLNAHLGLADSAGRRSAHGAARHASSGAVDPSIASSGFWMWDRWLRARFSSHLMALRSRVGRSSLLSPRSRATSSRA